MKHIRYSLWVTSLTLLVSMTAYAHSVVPVENDMRISQSTKASIDPMGNMTPGGSGTDTKAQVGDILTFVIPITLAPNGATRGAGGYITTYVPANTEVVGARLIDRNGNTVAPMLGPLMPDGFGPGGRQTEFDALGLDQGSLSQVYADTGIFYSTDPRTARDPNNASITVFNGIQIDPNPTGAAQVDGFFGFTGPPFFSHNAWDRFQALGYGVVGGIVEAGRGSTPFGFGSPVAGPDTHYPFEKVGIPACSDGLDNDADTSTDYPADPECASAIDDDETAATAAPVGPWNRIQSTGSEIGSGGVTDLAGSSVRVGVSTALGFALSPDNPLPAGTNAVRFAVGELILGQEPIAEISLRVTGLPLDPIMNSDIICSEVFSGDAADPQQGWDNTWRYFVPSPACVSLNLAFELSVDKSLAVNGETLTYTLEGQNLSVNQETNVVITDTFDPADVAFVAAIEGPVPAFGADTLTWPAITLGPGDTFRFRWDMEVAMGGTTTVNRATYTSDALPVPGFTVTAPTVLESAVVIEQDATVVPTATTADSTVHYTVTATNVGTGDATIAAQSFVKVTLPTGFSFDVGTATINTLGVADPALGPGNALVFTNGLQPIHANSGTMVVEFDASVGLAVPPGLHTINLQMQVEDLGIGRDVENSSFAVAPLLVDIIQSDPPVLDAPVLSGATNVTGLTSEGAGTMVKVFINGNLVASVVAGTLGLFSVAVPTLFAGQHLNATAAAVGEIESVLSSPDVVVQIVGLPPPCQDGIDNDLDGDVDGTDLAYYISDPAGISLNVFSEDFGRTNCP